MLTNTRLHPWFSLHGLSRSRYSGRGEHRSRFCTAGAMQPGFHGISMQERRFGFPAKAVAFWLLNGLSAIGPGLCAHVCWCRVAQSFVAVEQLHFFQRGWWHFSGGCTPSCLWSTRGVSTQRCPLRDSAYHLWERCSSEGISEVCHRCYVY